MALRLGLLFQLLLVFSSAAAQQQRLDVLTEDFILSVQTIDDFFDRFNFSADAPSVRYLSETFPTEQLTRRSSIIALFNSQNKSWVNDDIVGFVDRFGNDGSPKLDYSQPNWYAVLHSKVVYNGKRWKMDIVMIAEPVFNAKTNSLSYKWSLISVKSPFLTSSDTSGALTDSAISVPVVSKDGKFLHPMSHAINFMNIYDIFKRGMTRNYFARKARSPELVSLAKMVDKSAIRFIQVDSISYQLLQLSGWIIKVDYFDRSGANSGWLISNLKPATDADKKKYLSQYLNIR